MKKFFYNSFDFLKKLFTFRLNYRHYICIFITIGFAFLPFVFPNAFGRLVESLRDLGLSFAYYFCELFYIPHDITSTVTEVSRYKATIFLPFTIEEFIENWGVYWQVWATSENLGAYMEHLGDLLVKLSKFLVIALPFFILIYILVVHFFNQRNNDYDKDSKPLKFYRKIERKLILPVKHFILEFVAFLKARKAYWIIWLAMWLLYFNIYSIIVEFVAFYFYFIVSFNFTTIYRQLYKLLVDLATPITFIPLIGWAIIIYLIINAIRRKIALAVLRHHERKNCGFINERPIVFMVVGSMGKKKTTLITDMCLSQEAMLRDKAFELLLANDLKFPRFPWINFENALKRAIGEHKIFNLSTCKSYVERLSDYFYKFGSAFRFSDNAVCKSVYRHLKKEYKREFGFFFDGFLFGYDHLTYGFYYDDKLKEVDVWQVLETYSQLYFIYLCQSSLILSNYSVRTDNIFSDSGNFPLWDTDFFKRDSKFADFNSRHSHILDFDSLRLGKKVVEENKLANSFDFGVIAITEIGKERGNNLELNEVKKKSDFANQKNDLFNSWLKMVRHSATVDNFPFVRVIVDEQRPESWGADARDLCQIVHIEECTETKLSMPFFALGEIFNALISNKFRDRYVSYRYNRGDNSIIMHLYKGLCARYRHYYDRIYNLFGYMKVSLTVEEGTQVGKDGGALKEAQYYLSTKKIYSKRFSTDCFSDLFAAKTALSDYGLNDLPEFETEKASVKEMLAENSYFFNDLFKVLEDIRIVN